MNRREGLIPPLSGAKRRDFIHLVEQSIFALPLRLSRLGSSGPARLILIAGILSLSFLISGCLETSSRDSLPRCILPQCTASIPPPAWRPDTEALDGSTDEMLKNVALRPDVGTLRSWQYIVLHHSATAAGGAATFDTMHKKKGWDGLGYHFVIGNGTESRDGEIEVGFRWKQQREGAHAGNTVYNQLGIGICLVGNFEKSRPTQKQLAALNALLLVLTRAFGVRESNITLHRVVRDEETACPGKLFPVQQVLDTLRSSPK